MKTQYGTVTKMGSLNNLMSMIPGLSNTMLAQGSDKDNIDRIKKSLCILGNFLKLDSMNQDELNGKAPLTP